MLSQVEFFFDTFYKLWESFADKEGVNKLKKVNTVKLLKLAQQTGKQQANNEYLSKCKFHRSKNLFQNNIFHSSFHDNKLRMGSCWV